MAENNGSYNVGFKNLIDWLSRIKDQKTLGDKKMFLMATSPGKRGGTTLLTGAVNYFPFLGAEIVGSFSLPEFNVNFKDGKVTDETLNASLKRSARSITVKRFNKIFSSVYLFIP
jgi:NAD(P)H-dependent FMN reductase